MSLFSTAKTAWRLVRRHRRYIRGGMQPWQDGYFEYKQIEIARALADRTLDLNALPGGYGFRLDERIVEYPWFFSRLPADPGRLLDAGSVLNFDFLLDQPALKNKNTHICTLAPEPDCFWHKGASYVFEDLRRLPYRDETFDWVVCLSTLEHVGMDNTFLYTKDTSKNEASVRDYLKAVSELRRVLKPGGRLFASVPFGRAQNHGWLQIFDEAMLNDLTAAFAPARCDRHYYLYFPEGWRNSSATDAAEATFFNIHAGKGYDSDYAASSRAICCLDLTKLETAP